MNKCVTVLGASLLLAGLISVVPAQDEPAEPALIAETPAQRDARMAWWRDARFGMFIHWGAYTNPI